MIKLEQAGQQATAQRCDNQHCTPRKIISQTLASSLTNNRGRHSLWQNPRALQLMLLSGAAGSGLRVQYRWHMTPYHGQAPAAAAPWSSTRLVSLKQHWHWSPPPHAPCPEQFLSSKMPS
eukprot:3939621-Rhodomonas_salina.2